MGSIEKKLGRWRKLKNSQTVPRNEVEAVLNRYFSDRFYFAKGSHIILTDKEGEFLFSVPVKSGQRVKARYLKKIVEQIEEEKGGKK